MDTLLRIGLSNAAAAAALAVVAVLAGRRWGHRPALVHGLWLLVLLKLLTPPLVWVPVPVPAAAPGTAADPEPPAPPADSPGPPATRLAFLPRAEIRSGDAPPDAGSAFVVPALGELPARPPQAEPAPAARPVHWRPILVGAWAAGAAAWFLLAGVRLARFARLLRFATPAPAAVQAEADEIAGALGMGWCPVVYLLPGRVAPMVWAGLGTPRLLLPAALVGQLGPGQLRTLMAHELAHLRRGDHRVRLVEFFALGLFWWHPVVWFARRALREAEEQCCDAWVVSALPGAGKAYATALLETLDFLSAAPAAPPLASGIGQVSDMKRRLTMIMRGSTPRALCWREGLAVLGLALLLPLLPALARGDEPEESGQPPKRARSDDDRKSPARDGADVDKARAELDALRAELRKKEQEVREASRRLNEAAREFARAQSAKAREKAKELREKASGAGDMANDLGKQIREQILREFRVEAGGKDGKGRKVIIAGPIEIEVTDDGQVRVRKMEPGRERTEPAPGRRERTEETRTFRGPDPEAIKKKVEEAVRRSREAARRSEEEARRKAREASEANRGKGAGKGEGKGEGKGDDRRLDQLERRLDAMMRELEALRKDRDKVKEKGKGDSERKERRPGRSRRSGSESEEDD